MNAPFDVMQVFGTRARVPVRGTIKWLSLSQFPYADGRHLAKTKTAKANWEKLSFTNKKEIALSISGAKQEETRARRLAKAMEILKTGKKWTGLKNTCHPERSEGSGFLPVRSVSLQQANTQIPRFARDDRS